MEALQTQPLLSKPSAPPAPTAPSDAPPRLLRDTLKSAASSPLAASQEDFQSVISRARNVDLDTKQKTRQAAEDFISMAFIQPILKQLRETNNAAPPFAPGEGEKMFRQISDAHLSRRLVRSTRWPLVDQLARGLLAKAEGRVPERPAPRYGPKLDKVRPQLEPVKNRDEPATDQPGLDAQA